MKNTLELINKSGSKLVTKELSDKEIAIKSKLQKQRSDLK